MKKHTLLAFVMTSSFLFAHEETNLHAEPAPMQPKEQIELTSEPQAVPKEKKTLFRKKAKQGEAATAASKQAESSDWKGWIFASSLVVTAVVGITLIATSSGASAQ